jgi:vesicular inhibitory amino acid transporter
MLGLETTPPPSSPEDSAKAPLAIIGSKRTRHPTLKRFFIIIERIAFTLLSVGVSIVIPEFSSAMAFLGSFSAFIICVIGPVYAKSALAGRWEAWDVLLWVVAIVMAVWGTAAAFMSS